MLVFIVESKLNISKFQKTYICNEQRALWISNLQQTLIVISLSFSSTWSFSVNSCEPTFHFPFKRPNVQYVWLQLDWTVTLCTCYSYICDPFHFVNTYVFDNHTCNPHQSKKLWFCFMQKIKRYLFLTFVVLFSS